MIYFVSTPIGNLKDITLRALEVLRSADVIFCEDTRRTLKLLNAYDIKKPLKTCHKFNERESAEKIIAAAREGGNVAVVSDAGMPVISDPGNAVCRQLKAAGEQYTVVPGANAALSALILSAFPADKFLFVGFLPEKAGEKRRILRKFAQTEATLIFHVAPQDIASDVAAMAEVLGNRRACAVREITKLHEEAVEFELAEGYKGEARGEFVIITEGAAEKENELNSLSVEDHILHYMSQGMDKKEAIKQVAKDRGEPKSEIYKRALNL